MQIQRIQTVYIFLAIVAMAIFMVVPYGEVVALGQTPVAAEQLYTMAEYGILIPVATVIILLLVDMFLFRNMPLQRTVLVISFMITLAVIATVCFTLFKEARAEGMATRHSRHHEGHQATQLLQPPQIRTRNIFFRKKP